jgi:UrcA family protein
MRTNFPALSFIAAAGLALTGGLALAQQREPMAAPLPVEEVVVVAPYLVREKAVEQRPGKMQVLSVSVQRAVSYKGLDLSRQGDISEFETRIRNAARDGCVELERMYRDYQPITSRNECIRMATRDGLAKMEDVVAATTAG